ncbi:HNH endonuclease [Alloyangia pacifica]|uniref:HNH endonuclease n=1 Tax=Alloyangia pacifica TaxID=311180 RepID=UPI000B8A1C75|nr:hypothetical protein [Alloyangia pacifica]
MGRLSGRGLPSRLGAASSRLKKSAAQPSGDAPGRRSHNWLNTSRWRRVRQRVLERDCYVCQQTGVMLIGKYPAANSPVVDHIKPHRGDPALFWDEKNLQAVSKVWHDRTKQSLEKRGLA